MTYLRSPPSARRHVARGAIEGGRARGTRSAVVELHRPVDNRIDAAPLLGAADGGGEVDGRHRARHWIDFNQASLRDRAAIVAHDVAESDGASARASDLELRRQAARRQEPEARHRKRYVARVGDVGFGQLLGVRSFCPHRVELALRVSGEEALGRYGVSIGQPGAGAEIVELEVREGIGDHRGSDGPGVAVHDAQDLARYHRRSRHHAGRN